MKETLRKQILAQRANLSQEDWAKGSQRILEHLLAMEQYAKANRIFTFISMGKEVDTYSLIAKAWQDGKEVAVPIAKKKEGMFFVVIHCLGDLVQSPFGVMEPVATKAEEVIPTKEDLFLVPGGVFDCVGNRYGYGGGFYDRYCEQHTGFLKLALAFSFQVQEEPLAVEPHDIPVDLILSEQGIEGGANICVF